MGETWVCPGSTVDRHDRERELVLVGEASSPMGYGRSPGSRDHNTRQCSLVCQSIGHLELSGEVRGGCVGVALETGRVERDTCALGLRGRYG